MNAKYYARVQNACLQVVERPGAFQNFWKFSPSNSYFLKIGFLGEKEAFKKNLESTPTSPHHEGKHSEPWHNVFGVLFDTFITPLGLGVYVIFM